MVKIFTLVTWGSETERDCSILGTYSTMKKATDRFVSFFTNQVATIFQQADLIKELKIYKSFLEQGFIVVRCDYYQIQVTELDAEEVGFPIPSYVQKKDGKLFVTSFVNHRYEEKEWIPK